MDRLLIGIGAVVIIIAGLFAYRYFKNQKNGKEEAQRFLKELEEQMYLISLNVSILLIFTLIRILKSMRSRY